MASKGYAGFESEAALCARFIAAVEKVGGWTCYAETAGWDILLSRHVDGFQIGVQAKLRLNVNVINQALDYSASWGDSRPAPDCRAVLVPAGAGGDFRTIAAYLGLTIIRCYPEERSHRYLSFDPDLPTTEGKSWRDDDWHEWLPAKRETLPAYVPDVAAGASAPLQLTDWKIRALKIAVLLEARGFVTRADFKHIRIDHRRWTAPGADWLLTRDGVFVPGPRMPDFKAQHPRVFEEIKADFEKWAPPESEAPSIQPVMV